MTKTGPALPDGHVPLVLKLCYAGVNLPMAFIGLPLVIYLAPYYAGELGLPLGIVGTALFLGRLTDVISDALIGLAADRYHTRFGRRRPWLVAGGLVMLLGVWLLFMPAPPVSMTYLLVSVGILYLGFTMVGLPHEAWGAELSPAYAERTRITAMRQFFSLTGLVIATAVPAWVIAQGGTSGSVLFTLGLMFMILMPLAVAIAVLKVPEPPTSGEGHPPFWRGLRLMWRNGPFKRVLIVLFVAAVGETFRVTITYFFARSVIGLENLGLLYLWYFLTGLAAVPLWARLGNRLGKHRALALAFTVISLISIATFFLQAGDRLLFTLLFAAKGFCFGALQLLPSAMIADIVDVDRIRSSRQRQGLFFAMSGLALKLGMAFGQGLSLNLLAAGGFDAAASSQGDGVLLWLRVLYCLVPTLLFLLVLRLTWDYPLTGERHARLRRHLARRGLETAPVGSS